MSLTAPRVSFAVSAILIALLGPLLVVTGFGSSSRAFAHGGEIELGGGAKGPVFLSEAKQKAIALQLAPAELRPLSQLLQLNGEVRLVPGHQADVSTRISGQVQGLYANLGETVKAGQRLVRVQSRLVGDPPPSVEVTAPMSGVVDALNVTIGQSVEPTTVLYQISDRAEVDVVARVYEEDLGKVRVGQYATVHTLSYPDRAFSGKVMLIGPSLDPDSRTVELWIRLANPDSLLKPNLFARVSVVLQQNDAALAIPNAAIIEANGEKFVFVGQNGKYERVDISVGTSDDQYTEVTDGVVPGDEVVTQGNRQIYTLWLTGGTVKGEDE
jgi:membrane fusion protein, heavy metal efflux system